MRLERAAWLAALGICAALVVSPWRGHVDDQDAQLYLVVERAMAAAHEWIDLRALPGFYPRFREHLPFAFWLPIAAIRLFGEWAVNPLNALLTLAAIAVAGRIAARIGGPWAGVSAIVLLGTCEAVWQYGGRPLLEPSLFLFATAAAGAALGDRWILAAFFGAIAGLIKGPFGLLPLACVALAKLPGWRGLLAAAAATVPIPLFIWIDPAGGWRTQYLHERLFGLASGSANNGIVMWWFPVSVVMRRFWPGFPLLFPGLVQSVRNPRLRTVAVACLLMLGFLCLPKLKWGNHTYVAFPLLAVLAGVAAGSLLQRLNARLVAGTLAAACVAAWALSLSGTLARVLPPPCAFSTVLAPALELVPPGEHILVVSPAVDTSAIVALAAERRLSPSPAAQLPEAGSVRFAVVRDGIAVSAPWKTLARGGGWSLVRY